MGHSHQQRAVAGLWHRRHGLEPVNEATGSPQMAPRTTRCIARTGPRSPRSHGRSPHAKRFVRLRDQITGIWAWVAVPVLMSIPFSLGLLARGDGQHPCHRERLRHSNPNSATPATPVGCANATLPALIVGGTANRPEIVAAGTMQCPIHQRRPDPRKAVVLPSGSDARSLVDGCRAAWV